MKNIYLALEPDSIFKYWESNYTFVPQFEQNFTFGASNFSPQKGQNLGLKSSYSCILSSWFDRDLIF